MGDSDLRGKPTALMFIGLYAVIFACLIGNTRTSDAVVQKMERKRYGPCHSDPVMTILRAARAAAVINMAIHIQQPAIAQ
jgi:hypothetical protein